MMEITFYSQVTASADTCLFLHKQRLNVWKLLDYKHVELQIKGFYQQEPVFVLVFGQTMKKNKISHFYPDSVNCEGV